MNKDGWVWSKKKETWLWGTNKKGIGVYENENGFYYYNIIHPLVGIEGSIPYKTLEKAQQKGLERFQEIENLYND